jgi:hypothetical protein
LTPKKQTDKQPPHPDLVAATVARAKDLGFIPYDILGGVSGDCAIVASLCSVNIRTMEGYVISLSPLTDAAERALTKEVEQVAASAQAESAEMVESMREDVEAYVTEVLLRAYSSFTLVNVGSSGTLFAAGARVTDLDYLIDQDKIVACEEIPDGETAITHLERQLRGSHLRDLRKVSKLKQIVGDVGVKPAGNRPTTVFFTKRNGKKDDRYLGKTRARCEVTLTKTIDVEAAVHAKIWLHNTQLVDKLVPAITVYMKLLIYSSTLLDNECFKLPSIALTAVVAASVRRVVRLRVAEKRSVASVLFGVLAFVAHANMSGLLVVCDVAGGAAFQEKGAQMRAAQVVALDTSAPTVVLPMRGWKVASGIRGFALLQEHFRAVLPRCYGAHATPVLAPDPGIKHPRPADIHRILKRSGITS